MKKLLAILTVHLLILAMWGFLQPADARADSACEVAIEVQEYDASGNLTTEIRCQSASDSDGTPNTERRCVDASSGDEIPCSTQDGVWDASRGCYTRVSPVQDLLPEDSSVPMQWIRCTPVSGLTGDFLAPVIQPPPPDPRQLAEAAISRMALSAIDIGSYPHTTTQSSDSIGVVGWNVWMWVEQATATTLGPITRSASAGGYTVTATAQVTEVVWDMGNGDTVTCGKGTKYTGMGTSNIKSPTCGYTYTDDGDYQITATTHWVIDWTGIGQSGTITMELETPAEQLTIAEVQVVNVPLGQR